MDSKGNQEDAQFKAWYLPSWRPALTPAAPAKVQALSARPQVFGIPPSTALTGLKHRPLIGGQAAASIGQQHSGVRQDSI